MGLTILHTADWHLDSPFSAFPEEERRILRSRLRELPEMTTRICREAHCDLVLLAGDIFDGAPTRDSLALLKGALERCRVPVLISPGNHDFCGPGSPWLEETWPENVYIFTGGLSSVAIPSLDCRVYGAGYSSMDCPALLRDFRAEGTETYCIGLLHGDPTAASSPCCPIRASDVRESGLDYLALGHIHKTGSFRAGNTLCAWPGCPMGRGWDETGEKGVLLVSLNETAEAVFHPLPLPRFFDLTVAAEENPLRALEAVLPPWESQDYYRVTLTGYSEMPIARLREAFSRLPHLTLLDSTRKPVDLWAESGADSLRGVTFRMLQELHETGSTQERRTALEAARILQDLLDGKEVMLP